MSEEKFTKGEWVVVDKNADTNQFDQEIVNNIVKMPKSQKTKYGACFYAALGGFDIYTQKVEAEANAHLIASAPDMYKMLEYNRRAWLNLIDLNLIKAGYEKDAYKLTDEIESLLAKARG